MVIEQSGNDTKLDHAKEKVGNRNENVEAPARTVVECLCPYVQQSQKNTWNNADV